LKVTQLAYMLEDRLKEAFKDVDRKRALKDVSVATAKDKGKAAEDVEKRVKEAKKAQALVE